MAQNKEQLEKLLKFIDEVSNQKGNEWFKDDLIKSIAKSDVDIKSPILDEIYEYCINAILKNQAEVFYADFKLSGIKSQLVADFIRMEQFRRCDNFEDFCLAAFQQVEAIVNELADGQLQSFLRNNKDSETHNIKGGAGTLITQKLWQLIFDPKLNADQLRERLSSAIHLWTFSEKFKLILFKYYFKEKIHYVAFQTTFFVGNELYQSRNLNHRGGNLTGYQQNTKEKVQTRKHRYFLKFLGFLEDFTGRINEKIIY